MSPVSSFYKFYFINNVSFEVDGVHKLKVLACGFLINGDLGLGGAGQEFCFESQVFFGGIAAYRID